MGTVTAPKLRMAKSVIVHSGRFSPRMATRSPLRIPQDSSARASPTTLRYSSEDEIGAQPRTFRCSMTRSRGRPQTVSKMSFRVWRLIRNESWSRRHCTEAFRDRTRNCGAIRTDGHRLVIDELLCPLAAFKVAYAKCGGDCYEAKACPDCTWCLAGGGCHVVPAAFTTIESREEPARADEAKSRRPSARLQTAVL